MDGFHLALLSIYYKGIRCYTSKITFSVNIDIQSLICILPTIVFVKLANNIYIPTLGHFWSVI